MCVCVYLLRTEENRETEPSRVPAARRPVSHRHSRVKCSVKCVNNIIALLFQRVRRRLRGVLRKLERSLSAGGFFQPCVSQYSTLLISCSTDFGQNNQSMLFLMCDLRNPKWTQELCVYTSPIYTHRIYFAHSHRREARQSLGCCSLRLEWWRLESMLSANLWDYVGCDRWSTTAGSHR